MLIVEARKDSFRNLQQQAKRLKLQSNRLFPPLNIGTSVTLQIPEVDRSKSDRRNVLAVVLEVTKENLYKLGTKNGILRPLYSRNQIQQCQQQFLEISDVPNKEIALRTCAKLQSVGSGQGFRKCSCTKGCITKSWFFVHFKMPFQIILL